MKTEIQYRVLWHALRRIEMGIHEKDNKPMTIQEASKISEIALRLSPEPKDILPGYERS